jgi:hypothetical protein
MSEIFTKDFTVDCSPQNRTWQQLRSQIETLPLPGTPIRLIVTSVTENKLTFECSFLRTEKQPVWPSLLTMNIRQQAVNKPFVAVSIIPTGVRAEIGGFAGDATPSTNLLASACDYLITNPNAVTASDLYYAKDNVLYLKGNLICQLILGNLALLPEKHTSVAAIIEKPRDERFLNNILNALNGLRTVKGVNIDPVIVTSSPIETKCTYSEYGNASGQFNEGIDELMRALDIVKATETRAVGLITTLQVEDEIRQRYYAGEEIPNPWGGAEAILTHMTTNFYPFTAAHAPLLLEWEHTSFGTLSDPRDGAELISSSYSCSPLTGLVNSPRLIPFNAPIPEGGQRIGVENISAVVMPETTVGNIPFFASLDQNIPIILVKNPTQYNITPECLQIDSKQRKIYTVNSYMEAAGLLLALRNGIVPESMQRPFSELQPIFLEESKTS